MKLFGYGSLMNKNSLKKTVPEAKVVGKSLLKGYRRVFNVKSPYRKNEATGIYSSVLNIEESSESSFYGTLIELPDQRNIEDLFKREEGYDLIEITLEDNTKALTYMAEVDIPYLYVFHDCTQKEYLDICIQAAKESHFFEDFLHTTFIGEKTIAELDLI